jgi:hypothetical protein
MIINHRPTSALRLMYCYPTETVNQCQAFVTSSNYFFNNPLSSKESADDFSPY